jgi:hypothetical protein
MATLSNITTEIDADGVTVRELTAEEFAEIKSEQNRLAQIKVDVNAKAKANAEAKAAILERLGITEEEAQLIIGGSN